MSTMNLQQRIERANQQGKIARIPFITAGFPDEARFLQALRDLDASGVEVIEIGVPFSDPVADGPVVEQASRRALLQGVSLAWILERLTALNPRLNAGLVLMGYYNPFYQYGVERLAEAAHKAGVQGFVVPDLPLEESAPLRKAFLPYAIDLITLVGPNTSEARMREYAEQSTGYVYVTSVMGTTGVQANLSAQAAETLERAKKVFKQPIALGFGIQNAAQVEAMRIKPHAAVFGSALLRHLDAGGSVAEFMKAWP